MSETNESQALAPRLPAPKVMRIYITQKDNDQHFKQRLPTWRDGFCEIERRVTFCTDPSGCYAANEYGTISAYGKRVIVVGSQNADGTVTRMEIE